MALATEQYSEILVVDGRAFTFDQYPLEQLISSEAFIKLYQPVLCTAAWRGYQGRWLISDDKLYLQDINLTPCDRESSPADLAKLFPKAQDGVEATWVTMDIVVPMSERKYSLNDDEHLAIEYQAMVYKIEKGVLQSRTPQHVRER